MSQSIAWHVLVRPCKDIYKLPQEWTKTFCRTMQRHLPQEWTKTFLLLVH